MQRKDVERLAHRLDRAMLYLPDGDTTAMGEEAAAALRALLAERDAAFAAGQRDMQERAALEACRVTQQERADGGWRSEGMEMSRVLRDAVRALPIKPHP